MVTVWQSHLKYCVGVWSLVGVLHQGLLQEVVEFLGPFVRVVQSKHYDCCECERVTEGKKEREEENESERKKQEERK